MKDASVNCPHCHTLINISDALMHEIEEELRLEFQSKLNIAERAIAQKVKSETEQEWQNAKLSMQQELDQKSEKLKEVNVLKVEFEKLRREKDELASSIQAEAEQQLNARLLQVKEQVQREAEKHNEMRVKGLEKQLQQQKELTEEMRRKQQQGSTQLQGEVQELAIESWLIEQFPLDEIQEVKKGQRGADCLQIVNTRTRLVCGTIYYESKRTKEFGSAWIEKFKTDIRLKGADVGVLVTDVYPKGMERMGLVDGVWICNYTEFKALCGVLREGVIRVDAVAAAQHHRGDKMALLYDYLTGNEFKMRVEGIVEGFQQLKRDLEAEKTAMQRQWTRREKQLDKVLQNTVGMYGAIEGIGDGSIAPIAALDFPT